MCVAVRRSERCERLTGLYEFQQRLVELRLCSTDGRCWNVEVLQESTLQAATEIALSALPRSTALEQEGGVPDPYTVEGGAVEWRLRHFSPMTGRAGQTFAAELLDSSLVRSMPETLACPSARYSMPETLACPSARYWQLTCERAALLAGGRWLGTLVAPRAPL